MSPGLRRRTADDGTPRAGSFRRMYRGQTHFDFVGRRRWWFAISLTIIALGLVSLGVRGLNLGIDFRGGTSWTLLAHGVTQSQATTAAEDAGLTQPTVELIGRGSSQQLQVEADLNNLSVTQQDTTTKAVSQALAELTHAKGGADGVSVEQVGPTWGGEVTTRALVALVVFFVAVVIYISVRFEPKMAVAAFLAMIHDLLVTLGVYSLAGFQVTPDTVVAILTILGYSLYDTVVVFDRVRENTRSIGSTGRITYSDMINVSMNQTMARSINTTLVAVLPVLAVLLVGAQLLGATTLQDYGLALFIGLLVGAYSSIFIASPLLAVLREREPRYRAIRERLEARGERAGVPVAVAAAAVGLPTERGAGGSRGTGTTATPAGGQRRVRTGALRPGVAREAAAERAARASGDRAPGSRTPPEALPVEAAPPEVPDSGPAQSGPSPARPSPARAKAAAPPAAGPPAGAAERVAPRPRKRGKTKKRR